MFKTKVCVSLFLFMSGVLMTGAQQVDVTGDWELTVQTPRGDRTQQVHFEQDGENLTVTMEGRRGPIEAKGSVKGNDIEWSFTRETPRGEFTMTYTGTVEGDTMSGEVQMGDFGTGEWSAKRIK